MAEALAAERANSGIDSRALSHLLYGGRGRFERWRRIADVFEQDPAFDKSAQPFMNHTQRYLLACRKAARFVQLVRELGIAYDKEATDWAYMAVDDILPIDVHRQMFVPCIQFQTSAEQRERWLDDAVNFRILGAYAQTELGHGSNVRGIETTATFDPQTQEFVINSPTVTSTKWWPGGLGHTATHAVVHARLLVGGVDHGVHAFLVQIRSLEDHSPMPNVELGDIGPKVGFHGIDNGYARFHNVRIPRDHMLMGPAEVRPDGTYITHEGGQKLLYGAMLSVRTTIVANSAIPLAKALTIALRYSVVRRQGDAKPNGTQGASASDVPERSVLDYITQQATLLPLLAFAFATHFTGSNIKAAHQAYLQHLDAQLLPELHALTSGLKAYITHKIADGIEACRRMCGGHGYSQFSDLPEVSNKYLAMCTVEGTREVLEPQCVRYLLRCMSSDSAKPLPESVAFLRHHKVLASHRCPARNADEFVQPGNEDMLVRVFEARCVKSLQNVSRVLREIQATGASSHQNQQHLLSDAGIEAGVASRAFSQLYMLRSFAQHVRLAGSSELVGPAEVSALRQLFQLCAVHMMDESMADFRQDDLVSSEQAGLIRAAQRQLLLSVRPHAISLVEAWACSDTFLNSALGRSDGDVYRALVAAASREPLNATPVSSAYREHLRKILRPTSQPRSRL